MTRATKAAMTATTLPFAALPLILGSGPASAAASDLIPSGPATVLTHGPTPWAMSKNLGGVLCDAPKVCTEVRYDWIQPMGLIEIGVQPNVRRLDAAIHTPSADPKIVYAFSGGARNASVWLQQHADDKDAPSPDDLSFVLIGNGGRKYGGVNGWAYGDLLSTPTDTQYHVLDIAREYDPIADFPANPFNLLALANAAAAFTDIHMQYDKADLDDPDNIVWTEGNTTYVYIPTDHLPLLEGFYDTGMGWMVAGIEPQLKTIIDSAYNRTWLEGKLPQGPQGLTSDLTVVGDDAPTAKDTTAPAKPSGGKLVSLLRNATEKTAAAETKTAPTTEPDTSSPTTEPDTSSPTTGTDTSTPTKAGGKHRAPLKGAIKAAEQALDKAQERAQNKAQEKAKKDTEKKTQHRGPSYAARSAGGDPGAHRSSADGHGQS